MFSSLFSPGRAGYLRPGLDPDRSIMGIEDGTGHCSGCRGSFCFHVVVKGISRTMSESGAKSGVPWCRHVVYEGLVWSRWRWGERALLKGQAKDCLGCGHGTQLLVVLGEPSSFARPSLVNVTRCRGARNKAEREGLPRSSTWYHEGCCAMKQC